MTGTAVLSTLRQQEGGTLTRYQHALAPSACPPLPKLCSTVPLQDESRADLTSQVPQEAARSQGCHLAGTFSLPAPSEPQAAPHRLGVLNLEPGFVPFRKLLSVITGPSCAVFRWKPGEPQPVITAFRRTAPGKPRTKGRF